ncbi:hypothetical protein CKAH01_13533 [Colletotrichum kahawae]|uniref:Ankyrin repeat protein n=1 Tax=Colletotrichum kahawae TaxID=34407 RepID=A0AAD9YN29_COLKA|nr:hypothetical protein CKAH01_13533 [Colletotrichum kahawae]
MADQRHFFLGALVFFAIGTAATDSEEDDNLFDFYNDLVTDLGPFLAPFGESMTKQYLSESISLIDYFIFAMGPIGIITTLVSVIRLCGYTSLKAFIGRSQEGSATVEAELITSTSRDVCELYNHGGISRLVGQPRILELIYIPPSERSLSESSYSERSSSEMSSSESLSSESSSSDILHSQMSDAGDFKEELQLFRYYLNNKGSDSTHWTEERGSYLSSWLKSIWSWWLFKNVRQIYEKQGSGDVETAQMDDQGNLMEQQKTHGANTKRLIPASLNPPNLSLNIGITQPSPWATYSVAALGLILQGGVVALAATDAWLLGWSFDGNSTVSKDAPFLYLIGTVVMCCGLMACAALIGQTTQETRYNHTLNSQSRLIWLQPKQVIADQSFDPFAFFETNDKAIKAWICSWKVEDKPNSKDFSKARNSKGSDPKQLLKDTITYFWIMIPRGSFEFISFVSTTAVLFGYILQFTGLRRMKPWVSLAQLVITILMSILRGALRMQRLSKEDNKLQDSHDLVVGYELDWLSFEIWRRFKKESSQTQTSGEEVQAGVFKQVNNLWQNLTAKNIRDNSSPKRLSNHDILTNPTSFQELFSIRKRLAHLSGNFSESEKMDENEFQNWDDHYVNVRDKAKRLSAAICAIAESFVDQGQPFQDITLQFDNLIPGESRKNSIKLLLKEPGGLTTHWTMDSAPLEAILGLSMWTIISDQRFGKQFEHETNLSAESLQSERIFTLRRGGSGIEMELWFGPRMLIPTKACVKLPTERTCGLFDLWETLPGRGNHKRCIPIERSRPQASDNEEESVTSGSGQPTVAQRKSFDNDKSVVIVPCSALYSYEPTVTNCSGRHRELSDRAQRRNPTFRLDCCFRRPRRRHEGDEHHTRHRST